MQNSTANAMKAMNAMKDTNPTDKQAQRHAQLEAWLASVITDDDYQIISLPGDASFRRYHRVYIHDDDSRDIAHATKVYIVMDAPPEQESVLEFVQVAELMADYVNVPDIVAKDMEAGFLMLQDFGTTEFAHLLVDATAQQIDGYYQQAMKTLSELQLIDTNKAKAEANLPDYDIELLNREMDLLTEWFLPYIGVELGEKATLWQALKNKLMADILAQPQVVVHRDYHSRNLMLDQADASRLGVIDFQDAVIGAYSYDLVSLVRDAYVHWDETTVTKWINDFWAMLEVKPSQAQFYEDVTVMGVQRHLKVLGIFVRLAKRDGKTRYLADVPKVMDDMLFELKWLQANAKGELQTLASEFVEWLTQAVIPAYRDKFVKANS